MPSSSINSTSGSALRLFKAFSSRFAGIARRVVSNRVRECQHEQRLTRESVKQGLIPASVSDMGAGTVPGREITG
jgi:hypothetical protein